jgi:hypothetical protein
MSLDDEDEPRQRMPKRAEIPITVRREFLKNLETAAKPKGSGDNGSEEERELSYVVDAVVVPPAEPLV